MGEYFAFLSAHSYCGYLPTTREARELGKTRHAAELVLEDRAGSAMDYRRLGRAPMVHIGAERLSGWCVLGDDFRTLILLPDCGIPTLGSHVGF